MDGVYPSQAASLVLNCNKRAVQLIRDKNFAAAEHSLRQAEQLCEDAEHSAQLRRITYNNFGCLFKRCNQFTLALEYYKKALEGEAATAAEWSNRAGTHLNVCSVLSLSGKHSSALNHAKAAVAILDETPSPTSKLVALHHLAAEYEYLHKHREACGLYRNALSLATQELGSGHQFTQSLQQSIFSLQKLEQPVFPSLQSKRVAWKNRDSFEKPRHSARKPMQISFRPVKNYSSNDTFWKPRKRFASPIEKPALAKRSLAKMRGLQKELRYRYNLQPPVRRASSKVEVPLQTHLRPIAETCELLRVAQTDPRSAAARTIQAKVRQRQCRALFVAIRTAAISIQRAWRGFCLRRAR